VTKRRDSCCAVEKLGEKQNKQHEYPDRDQEFSDSKSVGSYGFSVRCPQRIVSKGIGVKSVVDSGRYSIGLVVDHRVHFLSKAASVSTEPLAFAGVAAPGHVTFRFKYGRPVGLVGYVTLKR
jgi:hypothetical protein